MYKHRVAINRGWWMFFMKCINRGVIINVWEGMIFLKKMQIGGWEYYCGPESKRVQDASKSHYFDFQ